MSSTAITAINEATTIGLAETAVNQMMLMLGGIKNSDHNSHATVWTLKDGLTVESSRNGDNDLLYAKMYADGDLFSTTVFKGSLEDVASEVDSWCWGATQAELGTEAIDGVHHQLLVDWEDAYKDEAAGYVEATSGTPDVVVLNTCAVRENADNRLYGNLGHLRPVKDAHPGMQIAVGGCLAQKDRGEIVRRAPWVDVVFGTHNVGSLPALLERARHN